MGKFTKPLLLSITVSSFGLAVYSCKSATKEDSSESNFFDAKKRKINEQIKSFSDTGKELQAANDRSAPGCEKLDILWNKIVETQQVGDDMVPPKSNFREVIAFGNGAAPRFLRIFQGFTKEEGGSELRPYEKNSVNFVRLTHRFSAMARAKFVPNAEVVKALGYTGQFAEGNNCILGRFSSAVPPSSPDRHTPSIALKIFQDGPDESQTLIGMHDIGGQSSGVDYTVNPPQPKTINNNFFAKNLSNRLSLEKGVPAGTGAFSRFYYSIQYFAKNFAGINRLVDPRELQADHLSERTPTGKKVAAPKGPRFVWFSAPADVRAKFGELAKDQSDYRKNFMAFNSSLNGGANPLTVYNVYGSDTWTYAPEKDAKLIGNLVITSNFVASEAADVRLFFKHSINLARNIIPDAEGGPNPYSQDYPFAEWGDKLFTSECRLGVREAEVAAKDLNDLDGTFIRDALLNPKTVRKTLDGKLCIIDIVEDRIEETAGPAMSRILP